MEFAHIAVLPIRGGVDIGVGIGAEIFIDMAMGMGRNIGSGMHMGIGMDIQQSEIAAVCQG